MSAFNLYAHHEKLSFHLQSANIAFQLLTIDSESSVDYLQNYAKSNQSGNISLQKLTRLKKNCDCTKITGESLPLLPSPWRVRAKMTMIPSLDQREGLATKFWAKLEDPSYFLDRFDMEWAIIVSKNTRYEIPRFVATNTTCHWHLLRGRFHKLHCLL